MEYTYTVLTQKSRLFKFFGHRKFNANNNHQISKYTEMLLHTEKKLIFILLINKPPFINSDNPVNTHKLKFT